jgi:type IX secretion system PorP/SprF family membrane protein
MNLKCTQNRCLLFLFLFVFVMTNAQENEQYTQYLYNPIAINPAFAGASEGTVLYTSYRSQWTGLNGSPKTGLLSVNGRINDNMGLGFSVVNDKIGPTDASALAVDFSYSLKLNEKYKLAFGLKASANLLNVDLSKVYLNDPDDFVFETNIDNKFSPNVGVGLYLHSDKTAIGLSAPNLLTTKFYDSYISNASNSHITKDNLHFFLTADHTFDLGGNLRFKPALLIKVAQDVPVQTNVSANFIIQTKFTLGMAYRFGGTISNTVGFQLNDSMFIGYGYDLATTKLPKYNSASHEIFLKYEFIKKKKKYVGLYYDLESQ